MVEAVELNSNKKCRDLDGEICLIKHNMLRDNDEVSGKILSLVIKRVSKTDTPGGLGGGGQLV
jgi:hypothetical protein